ncbi:MAG: MaoC family dehydratase [Gammaproteobacteria bacterium]
MATRLSFPAPPSIAAAYLRALFDRRPGRMPPGAGPVRIEAEAGALFADPARLAAYREVCELPDNEDLPLTYPHILAGGVHMGMLLHPDFPIRMVGVVHLANEIELFQRLPADARLALDCRLESGRTKPRGDEFRLVTEALWNDQLAWRETTSILAPAPSRPNRRAPLELPALPPPLSDWAVPADMGRRYARVSGDWNPIHLAAVVARPFGFPGAIAHGMWTVARCLGRLMDGPPGPGARLEVRFLKPLLLPGHVGLHAGPASESGDREFWLASSDTSTPHLKGLWNPGQAPG